jgi:hypothetical protein
MVEVEKKLEELSEATKREAEEDWDDWNAATDKFDFENCEQDKMSQEWGIKH